MRFRIFGTWSGKRTAEVETPGRFAVATFFISPAWFLFVFVLGSPWVGLVRLVS
jgi:hypothetical protein